MFAQRTFFSAKWLVSIEKPLPLPWRERIEGRGEIASS
jgi:hypothetical protein